MNNFDDLNKPSIFAKEPSETQVKIKSILNHFFFLKSSHSRGHGYEVTFYVFHTTTTTVELTSFAYIYHGTPLRYTPAETIRKHRQN